MMSTAPPLLLTSEQAGRLLLYAQDYRRWALASLPPTQERNTTLRVVQILQGKLLALCDHHQTQLRLSLEREEITALKAMTRSLLLLDFLVLYSHITMCHYYGGTKSQDSLRAKIR
ncbi:MAG TPA: hypothetical protein VHD63_14585 [Ktedonobacteraceae bacterium]|nr:hypothetical protein [Ktedonobacteraceae bacterium]